MSKKTTKCMMCGTKMVTTTENRRYLPEVNVVLLGVEVRRCPECGEEELVVPAVQALHTEIARLVASKRGRLTPGEIRFLRTHLGYSSTDFARVMGVAAPTVSRWESKTKPQAMDLPAERLLRLMAMSEKPIASYALEATGTDEAESDGDLRVRKKGGGWAVALREARA